MLHLVNTIPWDILAAWLLANVIPWVSALLTKYPSALTGLLTIALSFVVALLTNIVAAGTDSFDWKKLVFTTFTTWAVARLQHNTVVKGELAEKLHTRYGVKPRHRMAA